MFNVSVIIPYKDNLKYLFLTLKSVIKQSYKNFLIVIVYDDEKLSDLKKINKYITEKKLANKVRIIRNKKNLGVGKSRNVGINFSKSKYIAFIDSDDLWKKDKLKLQIKFMEQKKIPFSHTSYYLINENGKINSIRVAKESLFYKDLLRSCDIGLSTVMINSEFLKKNSLKFPSLGTKEDYVLWLKIIKKTKLIKGLNQPLTLYRKRKNSLSSNLIISFINGYKVYRNYLKLGKFESILRLLTLSISYLKKRFLYDFGNLK